MSDISSVEKLCDKLRALFVQPMCVVPALILLCLSRILLGSPADPDLFARVAVGRLIERQGEMPLRDPFSFTEKLPQWVDHEWLSGVVFWWIASHFGDAGLVILKAILLAATIFLTLLAARLQAPNSFPQTPFLAACFLDGLFAWGSTIRCQTFTYLFIAFQYYALVSLQKRGRYLYVACLPLISIAWVNLHGGYMLGMLTLWLWTGISLWQRQGAKPLLLVSFLSSCALFFTPYGATTYMHYLVDALTMERPTISEWAPLWTTPKSLLASSILAIPVIIGAVLFRDLKKQAIPVALLMFSLYLGVRHIRLGAFTSITFAILGSVFFQTFWHRLRSIGSERVLALERASSIVGVGIVAASAFVFTKTLFVSSTYSLQYQQYPVQAIDWLREQGIKGRLLVDFNDGSYALWRLYPNFTVSMDGRYEETYPERTVRLNALAFQFATHEGAAALEEVNPTHILLPVTNSNNEPSAALAKKWRYIYKDAHYAILAREIETFATGLQPKSDTGDMWAPLF